MKLSIIIPVYNVEQYVLECLDSIYKQKIDMNEFEVLCIDDRGTDKSIDKINNYIASQDISNCRVIKRNKNGGLSAARNEGINAAKGDYIMLLDSDDMLEEESLQSILNYLDGDVEILECSIMDKIETDLPILACNTNISNFEVSTGDEFYAKKQELKEYMPMSCIRIYKTKFIKETELFTIGIFFEDEEFTPRILMNAKKCISRNIPFYIYRRRDNSITTNIQKSNKWIDDYIFIAKRQLTLAETYSNSKSYNYLIDSASNLITSLLKNVIFYNLSDECLDIIVNKIRNEKLYLITKKSKSLNIRIQGLLLKHPRMFIQLYKILKRR
ncbi:glycosyltransferase [[Clostridium] innocuum]|uniref:glycosyltransferase family 2 protein n=1 Tax=Clostridium innocuum TaxID=1522 RepID=UPI001EE01F24|nr:glycosyltransferase family 2 protein [[Clostridium] innocuum]MCG4662734.1 glycosyltransferase [[Clostridium] innocuum]MCR0332745.1 glycosyltransferase [[Clostridium] innocuum]